MTSNETVTNSCSKKRALHESLSLSGEKESDKHNRIIDIPIDDFQSVTKKPRNNNEEDELLLLQLPDGLSMTNLISFSSTDSKNNNKGTSSPSQLVISSRQDDHENSNRCTLVTEDKSFDLIRVETSNAYILVPPAVDDNSHWKGRLLSETNTYFLECQETSPLLDLLQLQQTLLKQHCWCLSELAHVFGSSVGQVQSSLLQLAQDQYHVHFHSNDNDKEEISILPTDQVQSILSGIIDTLSEWDGAFNYTETSISIPQIIPHILQRIPVTKDKEDPNLHSILASILRLLSNDNNNSNNPFSKKEHVQIDPIKVARVIAHFILEKQPIWESIDDFVAVWQRRMPGVIDILPTKWSKGITLSSSSSQQDMEYYPETALSLSIPQRMEELFQKRDKWCLDQLQPYLQRFISPKQQKQQSVIDILLKYTTKTTDENSHTWYTLKVTSSSNP